MLLAYHIVDHMRFVCHKFLHDLLDLLVFINLNRGTLASLLKDSHHLFWTIEVLNLALETKASTLFNVTSGCRVEDARITLLVAGTEIHVIIWILRPLLIS
jgi:hypothetical protein